jgi:hypothetical protein
VSLDHRLAPEARFPAAVHGAYAALCWAGARIGELGGDVGGLVVAGDSAGGDLATVASQIARDRGARRPKNVPDGEGYLLTAAHSRWSAEQYFGADGDRMHPHASPRRPIRTGCRPPMSSRPDSIPCVRRARPAWPTCPRILRLSLAAAGCPRRPAGHSGSNRRNGVRQEKGR